MASAAKTPAITIFDFLDGTGSIVSLYTCIGYLEGVRILPSVSVVASSFISNRNAAEIPLPKS